MEPYRRVGSYLASSAVVINDRRHAHNFFAALYKAGYLSDLKILQDQGERIAILFLAQGVTEEMLYAALEADEVLPLPA